MKEEIQNCITYVVNRLAASYIYNWNLESKGRELNETFEEFYKALKEKDYIDFNNLTVDEALELRFGHCEDNLYLFPIWIIPLIPEGLEVESISGKKYKYDSKTADLDIRFGCVAFGIRINEQSVKCYKRDRIEPYSCNPDGLPEGMTMSEDQKLLNWEGVNYILQE